jgi:hypothetical protein
VLRCLPLPALRWLIRTHRSWNSGWFIGHAWRIWRGGPAGHVGATAGFADELVGFRTELHDWADPGMEWGDTPGEVVARMRTTAAAVLDQVEQGSAAETEAEWLPPFRQHLDEALQEVRDDFAQKYAALARQARGTQVGFTHPWWDEPTGAWPTVEVSRPDPPPWQRPLSEVFGPRVAADLGAVAR